MAYNGRDELLADRSLTGAALCRALSSVTDAWLQGLFAEASAASSGSMALVAVGGYGRGEMAPGSDLDLLLLHDTRRGIDAVAEKLWYPIWDAGLKLGHAVRTVKEAARLSAGDLTIATSLLEIRHLAGDARLTDAVREQSRRAWKRDARRWLAELEVGVDQRHHAAGEVAFLLEPNLKDGRGGLRDVHALRWAAAAEMVLFDDDPDELARAYEVLLGVRVELHRITGRPGDVLLLQEQDAVAERLGLADADALMSAVSAAARTIAWTSDETWRRIRSTIEGPASGAFRRDHPVAPGVVVRDGEIHLSDAAEPRLDPTLALRVGAAAARNRTTIERRSLDRLAAETPPMPAPWPPGASDDLVALLLAGADAIPVLESLDQRGLLVRVLPEWAPVRSKPQRNAYHRYTVDRHLWETAANAAALASRVHRADLLVLGALFHDIGKGVPGDHTVNGITLVEEIGPRLGLGPPDVAVLAQMVRHHLLLPDVATRRDLSDDATIAFVAEAVGTVGTLELLAALTEADSLATGPSAWGSWKAELVRELVERVAHVLGGGAVEEATWSLFPSPAVLAIMGTGETTVLADGDRLTTVAPDRPGLFSRVAGVLALHGLDVLGAQAHSDELGMAANEFRVAVPTHGIEWERVRGDLDRALASELAIEARLAERARTYRRRRVLAATTAPPLVRIDNDASATATVVEVHAPDRVGVLYRITKALAELGLDIRHARVQTLGHEVVDTFYVRTPEGQVTRPFYLRELERALLHAVVE
jgi:[protein-PII] uridylyltransferase